MYINSNNQLTTLVKSSYCFGRKYRHEWTLLMELEDAVKHDYRMINDQYVRLYREKAKLKNHMEVFLHMALRGPDSLDFDPVDDIVNGITARAWLLDAQVRLTRLNNQISTCQKDNEKLEAVLRKLALLKVRARKILFAVRQVAIQNDNPILMASLTAPTSPPVF